MNGLAVIAVICLVGAADPANNTSECVNETVVTSETAHGLTMVGCMGVQGLVSAIRYVEQHPVWSSEKYELRSWRCSIGVPAPDGRA